MRSRNSVRYSCSPRRMISVDAAVLQAREELAARCAAARRCARRTSWPSVSLIRFRQTVQRARHVAAQHQQLGHAARRDDVAVDLAVDLEARTPSAAAPPSGSSRRRRRRRRPTGSSMWNLTSRMRAVLSARSRNVPRRMKWKASSRSMVPTVTPRDRCERNLTHSKKLQPVALERAARQSLAASRARRVQVLPHLGGERAAHGARVLARRAQAGEDRRRIVGSLTMKSHHVVAAYSGRASA